MSYRWLRYLHILSGLTFVGIHGASMVVLYAIRYERDRSKIIALLSFSTRTVIPMYVSLGAVVVTGVLLGLRLPFIANWFWWSIALLAVVTVLMLLVAKPFTAKLRAACELRPSGVPRTSDEELGLLVRSPRTHLITFIGVAGLALILYLMVFRPAL